MNRPLLAKLKMGSIMVGTVSIALAWGLLPAIAQQPAADGGKAAPPAGTKGGGGRAGGGRGARVPDAPTGPAPRMPDGKVDFSGNWQPNAINENVDLARVIGEPPM